MFKSAFISFQHKPSDFWIHRRIQYGILRDLVKTVDSYISHVILLSFVNALFFNCKQLFLGLRLFLNILLLLPPNNNLFEFNSIAVHFQRIIEFFITGFRCFSCCCGHLQLHFLHLVSMKNQKKPLTFCMRCHHNHGMLKPNAFAMKYKMEISDYRE